jgi:hypothetical protein
MKSLRIFVEGKLHNRIDKDGNALKIFECQYDGQDLKMIPLKELSMNLEEFIGNNPVSSKEKPSAYIDFKSFEEYKAHMSGLGIPVGA